MEALRKKCIRCGWISEPWTGEMEHRTAGGSEENDLFCCGGCAAGENCNCDEDYLLKRAW